MIIKVGGKYCYRQFNVCFHVVRENAYTPWKVIGILASYHNDARGKYIHEFKHCLKEFNKECDAAGDLCGTYEFMENWRKQHVELNSVITPTIKYCMNIDNKTCTPQGMIDNLKHRYLGTDRPIRLAQIAIMLRSKPRFYSSVFDIGGDRDAEVEYLRSVGEVKFKPAIRIAVVWGQRDHLTRKVE